MPRSPFVVGSIALLLALRIDSCFARPQYKVAFEEAFPSAAQTVTCAFCHPAEDKRKRTAFAKKLEAALGERNVKDRLIIVAALKKLGIPKDPPAPRVAAAAPAVAVNRARIVVGQGVPAVRIVEQQVEEVDEDGNVVNVQVRRYSITHQNVDQWIFGSNKSVEQARREFESQLKTRIEALTKQYELDAAQQRKLNLAGRGDIKRFLGEAEGVHAELGNESPGSVITLNQEEYVKIQQRANALRSRYQSVFRQSGGSIDSLIGGIFDDHSLLSKTIPHAISPKFAEQYLADQKRQREQQYETYLTQSVQTLTAYLMLREDQKDKLKGLIRTDIAPPARFNQYASTYVMYHLSQMPNDKLTEVLDAAQINRFAAIKGNQARYEEILRANGMMGDPADERQEDAR